MTRMTQAHFTRQDPFWWSFGSFVVMMLLMIGLLGYFGTRRAGCSCERESGRCACRR